MVIKDDLEDLMCLNHVFYQSVMHFRKEAWIMIQDAMGTIICHFIKSKNKETCPSFFAGYESILVTKWIEEEFETSEGHYNSSVC